MIGGVEGLQPVECEIPSEGIVESRAIDVNFIDIYDRVAVYPRSVPFVPGVEAARFVTDLGSEMRDVSVGDRVAHVGPVGSYATHNAVPASRLVPVPTDLTDQQVAGSLLQGLSAHAPLFELRDITTAAVILVQAAAGGTGCILTEWATSLGVAVIDGISTPATQAVARDRGAAHTVLTVGNDWAAEGTGRHCLTWR
jgi:NADPH:quinone reductase